MRIWEAYPHNLVPQDLGREASPGSGRPIQEIIENTENLKNWDSQNIQKYKNVGFMGGRSRILRSQGDNFKKTCVLTSGYPSWGPMGPQEVQTKGFVGSLGGPGPLFPAWPIFARCLSWAFSQPRKPTAPRGSTFELLHVYFDHPAEALFGKCAGFTKKGFCGLIKLKREEAQMRSRVG